MTKTTELYTFKDELYGTIELYLVFTSNNEKKKVKAIFFKNVNVIKDKEHTHIHRGRWTE